MPLDGTDIAPRVRALALIEALRDKMPKGFTWDFSQVKYSTKCGSAGCAIGLASILWPDWYLGNLSDVGIADFFGISVENVCLVFFNDGGVFYPSDNPRPKTVAAALEKCL